MKKKIFLVCVALMSLVLVLSNVQASDLITVNIYQEEYIMSEKQEFDLPFMNQATEKIIYDKDVNHSGITYSDKEVEVLNNLKGIHLLTSNDTVTISGSVDYPIIIAQNVVIEGKVTGDAIIYAPSVYIKENAIINGDILVSTSQFEVAGQVKGSVVAYVSGACTIKGRIGNNLRVNCESIVFENEQIDGKILLQTNADTTKIKEKYADAVIETVMLETESNIGDTITKGVVSVVIFTILGFVFVIKDNNIFTKLSEILKTRTANCMLSGAIVLLASIAVILLLLAASIFGLWIVAVPIIAIYLALVIVSCMLGVFIVGTTIFELVKYKVIRKQENNLAIKKLGLLLLIYVVLYVLTVIPVVSIYVIITLSLISAGLIVSSFLKKK